MAAAAAPLSGPAEDLGTGSIFLKETWGGRGNSTLSAESDDRKPPQASIYLWVLLQGTAPQRRCAE